MPVTHKLRPRRTLPSWLFLALTGCLCAAALALNMTLLEHARKIPPQHDSVGDPLGLVARASGAKAPIAGAKGGSSEQPYMEHRFVYANQTYAYRFSTKFFQEQKEDSQDIGYNGGSSESESDLPSVLFGVCANAAKPVRRQAIRKSWGKEARVYFLVAGKWEDVAAEFAARGDLLWLDMPEDYRNALTPKTFALLHLGRSLAAHDTSLAQGLPSFHFDYIFKTDDDVYINVTEMRVELQHHGRPAYYGLLRENVAPSRDKTEKGLLSKWYLSEEDYPAKVFPPYAHGTGYALRTSFLECAVEHIASPTVVGPSGMPWEDVATGMLAQACGVPLEPADEDWNHFVPFESPESEWTAFPYQRFKDGNVPVKILHKVRPWFFEPLSQRASLVAAREYGGKKRRARKQRHQNPL